MGLISNGTTIFDAGAIDSGIAKGAMTLIKTLTASSSSTLSFVDGSSDVVLDSTYPIYLFKFINIHPSSNTSALQFQGSTDSGSNYNTTMTTTAFYASGDEAGSNTQFFYFTSKDQAQGTSFQPISLYDTGNENDESGVGELIIFNPSNTNFVKHFVSNFAGTSRYNYPNTGYVAGYFNTTSALDAFQFKMSSGNIDAGTIKLYGIKGS